MSAPEHQRPPGAAAERRSPDGYGSWRAHATAVLLVSLSGLLLLKGADGYLELGLFKTPQVLRLEAAARAVTAEKAMLGAETIRVFQNGGPAIDVPQGMYIDRVEALNLLTSIEVSREECNGLVARVLSARDLQDPDRVRPPELWGLISLWGEAQTKVSEFLVLDRLRAGLVLASLGWPWLGEDPALLSPDDLDRPFAAKPAVFESVSNGSWHEALHQAQEPRPWPVIEEELVRAHGLDSTQVNALRAYVCRRDLRYAFDSKPALRKAHETLERLIALTSVQAETVVAMHGAKELMDGGTMAFPPTIAMLQDYPVIGAVMLKGCLWRNAVQQQALAAAANLEGPDRPRAEDTLRAMGPFGREALQILSKRSGRRLGPAAERILHELETQWPGSIPGASALGTDQRRWWRWYKQARLVL